MKSIKVFNSIAIPIVSIALVSVGAGSYLFAKAADTFLAKPRANVSQPRANVSRLRPTAAGSHQGGDRIHHGSPLFYGMNWHPMLVEDPSQDREIALMQKAGIKSVRLDAEWASIEPTSGTYDAMYLSRLDNAIRRLDADGIEPLVVVTSTPEWVSGAPSGDPSPSAEPPIRTTIGPGCNPSVTICHAYDNVADYSGFLSFLMHRWPGKVHEYEIWSEPDGWWSWKSTEKNKMTAATDNAIDYTTLLKAAYRTAKSIDPSVTILGGSLSGLGQAQQEFLKTMYRQGARNYFDVYSQQYFCDPPSRNFCSSDRSIYDPSVLAARFTKNIYPILKANGDGNKPVWVTETGYNTDTAAGGVTESQQAQYLTQSFIDAVSLPSVTRLYWYDFDCTDSGSTYLNYMCILEVHTNRLKPAYAAFQQLTGSSAKSESSGK